MQPWFNISHILFIQHLAQVSINPLDSYFITFWSSYDPRSWRPACRLKHCLSAREFLIVTIHDSPIKLDQWGSSGNRELCLVQRTIVMLVGIIAASHIHCKFLMETSSTRPALHSKALSLKIPWGSLVSTTLPKLEQAISTSNLELTNSS